jgi:hypothetical protein
MRQVFFKHWLAGFEAGNCIEKKEIPTKKPCRKKVAEGLLIY